MTKAHTLFDTSGFSITFLHFLEWINASREETMILAPVTLFSVARNSLLTTLFSLELEEEMTTAVLFRHTFLGHLQYPFLSPFCRFSLLCWCFVMALHVIVTKLAHIGRTPFKFDRTPSSLTGLLTSLKSLPASFQKRYVHRLQNPQASTYSCGLAGTPPSIPWQGSCSMPTIISKLRSCTDHVTFCTAYC